MCYYNGQKVTREEFIRLKALERAIKKYDFLDKGVIGGFSGTPVAVLVPNTDKTNFDIVQMEWGFLPPYLQNRDEVERFRNGYKDPKTGKWKTGYTTLNATCENLFVNDRGNTSLFAEATRERRCLMLSTGYFEWQHIYRLKKNGEPVKSPDKYPYFISIPDHEYFFFAAIYQEWADKDTGEVVRTVANITAPAPENHLMWHVHNSKRRMPCILDEDQAWRWIMEDLSDEEVLKIAATQYPSDQMTACTIAKDFQALLDPTVPHVYEEVPALELSLHPGGTVSTEKKVIASYPKDLLTPPDLFS